jgi:PAS domain S-box-containing protein
LKRIALLVDHRENRHLLGGYLLNRYEVLEPEKGSMNGPFDLAILDGMALARLQEAIEVRKKAEGPVFLPFLLVTSRPDVSMITRHLWRSIDELIFTPIQKLELQARVEILLRARRYSVELQERYHTLAGKSSAGIFIVRDREVVYVNPVFLELTGQSREDLNASDYLELFHPHDRKSISAYVSQFPLDDAPGVDTPPIEARLYTVSGMRWVQFHATPIHYFGRPAVLAMALDIGERKQMEQELRIYTQKLEATNNELQEFVFAASHDLREPLRKVQTFGNMLATDYADRIDAEGLDYLERMQSATERMQNLLGALLTYSRVTTHGQPLARIDLNRVVEDAMSDLELAIKESRAQVDVGNLPAVDGDTNQMRQLFENLIGNAIKYVPEDHAPQIRISGEIDEVRCRIFVEDNGIGFDEKHLERIFQPFQRLHGHGRYEGMGMGLATCRRIVERHGGNITARSTPGEGSTFIVTLPLELP